MYLAIQDLPGFTPVIEVCVVVIVGMVLTATLLAYDHDDAVMGKTIPMAVMPCSMPQRKKATPEKTSRTP